MTVLRRLPPFRLSSRLTRKDCLGLGTLWLRVQDPGRAAQYAVRRPGTPALLMHKVPSGVEDPAQKARPDAGGNHYFLLLLIIDAYKD